MRHNTATGKPGPGDRDTGIADGVTDVCDISVTDVGVGVGTIVGATVGAAVGVDVVVYCWIYVGSDTIYAVGSGVGA
jgi:hypothetical protein